MKENNKENKGLRLEEEAAAYSFDEYYTFEEFKEMEFPDDVGKVELIDGVICYQGGATRKHEELVTEISRQFANYLLGKKCKVFGSNYTYVLQNKWKKERKLPEDTGVKPDIAIVCNAEILKEDAAYGAPTIAIEVLSKGTRKKDLNDKYDLYEENGVKEYWVIYPEEEIIEINYLNENGVYAKNKKFTFDDEINVNILGDFKLKVNIV